MNRKITFRLFFDIIFNRIIKNPNTKFFLYPRRGFTRYGTDKFIEYVSKKTMDGELILDAGAGTKPYSYLFRHAVYESCDSAEVIEDTGEMGAQVANHTFHCDINNIPRPNNHYDKIICSQVLEHVKDPKECVSELYRVLKPGGKLYITVPSIMGIHLAPHNYFNFLKFGLRNILNNAGFVDIYIEPQGGIFHVMGKVLNKSYQTLKSNIPSFLIIFFIPFDILLSIIIFLFSIVLFHIDFLDKDKDWTLNYNCICSK